MFSHVRGVSDGYDLCSHTSPEALERTRGLLSLGRHSHQWRFLLSIIWLSSSVSLPVPASSFYPLFGGVLESAVVLDLSVSPSRRKVSLCVVGSSGAHALGVTASVDLVTATSFPGPGHFLRSGVDFS